MSVCGWSTCFCSGARIRLYLRISKVVVVVAAELLLVVNRLVAAAVMAAVRTKAHVYQALSATQHAHFVMLAFL